MGPAPHPPNVSALHRAGWVGLTGAAALAAACAAPPKEVTALPPLYASVRHYVGSGVGGAAPRVAAESKPWSAAEATFVKFEAFTLESVPEGVLRPLPSQAQLIVAPSAANSVRSYSLLLPDAVGGFDHGADGVLYKMRTGSFGRMEPLCDLTGVLGPGRTSVFTLGAQPPDAHPSPSAPPVNIHIFVTCSRGEGGARYAVAVVCEDLAQRRDLDALRSADAMVSEPLAEGAWMRREALLLDAAPEPGGPPFVVNLRSPFSSGGPASLAIVVRLETAKEARRRLGAGFDAAIKRAQEDLTAAQLAPLARARWSLPHELQLKQAARALEIPSEAQALRRALAALGMTTGARFTADFALAAPDELVRDLAEALLAPGNRLVVAHFETQESLRDALEMRTLAFVAPRVGDVDFPIELDAVLTRHLGEVGRDSIAIDELARTARGVDGIHRMVVAMNLEYLRFPSPSSRVRAFDWLRVHELAPAGFDPFAPAAERKAVLDAFEDALEAQDEDAATRPRP